MTPDLLAETYLATLEDADFERMMTLFADDGMVHSPLYGPTPAARFYAELFRDTSGSKLTLLGVTSGETVNGGTLVSIWFHFDWRLRSGRAAPFDVVDVLELTAEGRIAQLHIVYDTVDVRPAFERDTGRISWRAGRQVQILPRAA